jgi:hypothetical protein
MDFNRDDRCLHALTRVARCIDDIRDDALSAVHAVEAEAVDKAALIARINAYTAKLKLLAEALPAGRKKQNTLANKLVLHSFEARVCAVLRAMLGSGEGLTLSKVLDRAKNVSVWKPLPEPVRVVWTKKDKGGYRPIVISGPMRSAQCLMVRDMLLMMDIDSSIDCTKKGGGGEKRLIANVCNDIENETNWWWTPDVKNCFGSIRPGHFGWLPIDRRLITNVMFLPKCAKVKVVNPVPEEIGLILQSLGVDAPASPFSLDASISALHSLSVHVVRRGLLQGSVLSPLLARAVIARTVNAALPHPEISRYSHSDDLVIGASNKHNIIAAKQAVTKQFSSLLAGPIELHETSPVHAASRRVVVLGYRLEPGNGYGVNVHVKPWRKRTDRFKNKLAAKLKKLEPGTDLFARAEEYRVQWFNSQSAWTKVPQYSDGASASITMSYVSDFVDGVPMGTWQANKPSLKAV